MEKILSIIKSTRSYLYRILNFYWLFLMQEIISSLGNNIYFIFSYFSTARHTKNIVVIYCTEYRIIKGNYFIHGNIYFRCTGTWTCLISRHVTTNPIIVTSFIPGTIEIFVLGLQ